jgi:ABC-type lipoprotein release transport system permease subunit
MELIKLAWRNLWRNKRRTAITSASILFAVFFAILMRSFQLGFYDHMIGNSIESFSGFLQVQHVDSKDDPSLDNTFECSDSLLIAIESSEGVKVAVPRIETFALASSGNQTKGSLIIGIDPLKEIDLSDPVNQLVRYQLTENVLANLRSDERLPSELRDKLKNMTGNSYSSLGTIAMDLEVNERKNFENLQIIGQAGEFPGKYLTPRDKGVLVSDRLAKYLQLTVGDSLIVMGQGFQGRTAAGIYPVRGIVKLANPELDNKLIYMTLAEAQYYASLNNRVTTIAINLLDNSETSMQEIQTKLNHKLRNETITVKNWMEFNEVLVQQIESDNQSGKAFLGLLYFIIFFGIFGTVLMMIFERLREFGVMVAVGMRKTKLAAILIFEMIFMGILGVLAGIVASLPVLLVLHKNPVRLTGDMAQVMEDMGFEAIVPLAWIDMYVLWQGLIVALMVILSCLYPLRKVFKLKEIDALKA